ncbi:hypothetical protein ILUMI_11458 [Ignelater luminosus]|uniref:CCHC-type domain-containing protein n=1 Tax=Ignelater luminosus TaxID=2038154 RepID=A0A8K0CVX8_IGNLU|nr:hypothetical protein ILUMI_11458 [Ignelater luminosus]
MPKTVKEKKTKGKCLRCWQEGHKANECLNESYCIACKSKAHNTNDMSKNIDILIVSEPNIKLAENRGWFSDNNIDASVIVLNKNIKVFKLERGDHWICIELYEHIICSNRQNKPVILGEDMNAKSPAWGSNYEDVREEIISTWSIVQNMHVANTGNTQNFIRDERKSFIGIILCTDTIAENITDWTVAEDEENFS